MNDKDLYLEDWKMTKDRIKHFDSILMQLRLHGLPIAAALQFVGFLISENVGKYVIPIVGFDFTVFSIMIMAAVVYLIPVLFLDIVHFLMLWSAVKHAIDLEKNKLGGKLEITQKLTNNLYTVLHTVGGYGAYAIIFVIGLSLISFATPENLAQFKIPES